ncbi:flavin-dependent monooxygenase QhpG [Pseudomonas vanderleydeniana]|uniref:Tryptophan 7-halogenase n=1 Tax=Pseudomonas vanderleydeniana TaxID=2745495 RepID=A0A9E6PK88_9PSED|nr:tryptophan 7-halogenase [Pseudomonas vanderleydeniana]QXI27857.1 tryptophan 7-halogenase [Pseudomonas vanderleydeniana]
MSILVLGAGPAGAAVALGLKRLGYPVRVISDWRRFAAVEGVSQRVLDGLRQAGLVRAVACANPASPRRVQWSGEERGVNQEFLIDRTAFDRALRVDLLDAGVELVEARVNAVETSVDGHRVQLDNGDTLHGEFLVEARGRQAPLAGKRRRGPETLSLLNRWQAQPGRPASAIQSLADGWAWMARLADGRCYWQLTLDAAAELPGKAQLAHWCARRRGESALVRELFGDEALQPAELHARSSTAIVLDDVSGPNWLRVGDAAMAVDPLSGNGIFQSLSSALQAPAVINTLLRYPQRAELARGFHQQRVEQLFLRFARTGRDFYALEQRWAEQPFWRTRRAWPDAEPMHAAADFAQMRVVSSAVVRGDSIEAVEVVVTADQPLGIWHLQGLELAPLVRALQAGTVLDEVLLRVPVPQQPMFRAWLVSQGMARSR